MGWEDWSQRSGISAGVPENLRLSCIHFLFVIWINHPGVMELSDLDVWAAQVLFLGFFRWFGETVGFLVSEMRFGCRTDEGMLLRGCS
jgi:hypothetical protein